MQSSVYISGPMHGYPEFNRAAFEEAETALQAVGWEVFTPATYIPVNSEGDTHGAIADGFNFKAAFKWDMQQVIERDAIYMLKGWYFSRGATAEHAVATVMKHYYPDYQIMYQQ